MSDAAPRLAAAAPSAVALVGAGDPGSSRLVYAMVIGLVIVGVALVGLGVWLVRQTRADLEVLAPLERMGDADWKKRDPSTQRRMLDEVRPEGAEPLTPEPKPPPIDADFEADHPVVPFSDLGPGVVTGQKDPTPIDLEADQIDVWPPATEVAAPDSEVAAPDSEVAAPDSEVAAPDSEVPAPDSETDVADAGTPDSDVGTPDSVVDGADSEPTGSDGERAEDADDEALSDPRG